MRPSFPSFAPRPRSNSDLVIFLTALAVLRLLFLFAAFDPLDERVAEVFDMAGVPWEHGPGRPLYDREEIYTGTAAEAIRLGAGLPWTKYQFMEYGGGSLVTTLLAVPIYEVFGPKYLAFKILPFLVTMLGGFFWFLLVRRHFGPLPARAFGWLYIFAPSMFVRTVWIAKGDHAEAMMWVGLTLYAASRAAGSTATPTETRSEENATTPPVVPSARWAGLAGLLAGLGVFLTYSNVPITATVFGTALLLGKGRPRKNWSWGGVGFGLGLLPWIVGFIRSRGSSTQVYGATLGSSLDLTSILERGRATLDSGFFAEYDLSIVLAQVGAFVFLLSVLLGFGTLWRALRHRPSLLVGIGALAQLGAFAFVAPDTASRYIVPAYPLLLLLIVRIAFRPGPSGWQPRGRRGWIPLVVVILFGIIAQGRVAMSGSYRSLSIPWSGTDWPLLGEVVGQKLNQPTIVGLPPEIGRWMWIGLGKQAAHVVAREDLVATAEQVESRAGFAARYRLWEGIGIGWVEQGRALEAGPLVDELSARDRGAFLRGLGRYSELVFGSILTTRPTVELERVARRMAGSHADSLRGAMGRTWAVLFSQGANVPDGSGLDATTRNLGWGWALYLGDRAGGIAERSVSQDRGRPDARSTWAGRVAAWERDLSLADAAWILENGDRAERIAALVEAASESLPERLDRTNRLALRATLYEAAGRVAGGAWQSPSLGTDLQSRRQDWAWQTVIPSEDQRAFARGLDAKKIGSR